MGNRSSSRTFWVDVEDFFQYFETNSRPSGIQRLVFEILSVLPERARMSLDAPRIAFVRHTGDDLLLREVTFSSVAHIFEKRPDRGAATERRTAPARIHKPVRNTLRLGLIARLQGLPPGISEALLQAGVLQLNALRQARILAATIAADIRRKHPVQDTVVPTAQPIEHAFAGRAGDVFLMLGAPWMHSNYGALLHRLRTEYQLEPALLLYDLIPVRRPEWCAAHLVKDFAGWLEATLPHCRRLMAISKATAADVEAYAHEVGHPLPGAVIPIPMGTGLGLTAQRAAGAGPQPRGLPAPGSYVLFVSTLEARKNHALLFRVWRRLLSELPRDQVPTLVFAGRVGWLVSDLLQQIENTDWLDGKIRLLRDPTDAELMALYRGCRFSLFPSLFEGWGLPVSESLALGCPCISSNRTSLPEAGGELARYFDPEDVYGAYRVILAVIMDPAGLEAWRQRVACEFRHVPWERTADAILAACSPQSSLTSETLAIGSAS